MITFYFESNLIYQSHGKPDGKGFWGGLGLESNTIVL